MYRLKDYVDFCTVLNKVVSHESDSEFNLVKILKTYLDDPKSIKNSKIVYGLFLKHLEVLESGGEFKDVFNNYVRCGKRVRKEISSLLDAVDVNSERELTVLCEGVLIENDKEIRRRKRRWLKILGATALAISLNILSAVGLSILLRGLGYL